jgi:hypothetical protein
MKKLIILSIIPILLFLSCNKTFLEETPKSLLVSENLYVSTQGFEAALNALYYHLREDRLGEDAFPAMFTGTDIAYSVFSHTNVMPFQTYGDAISPGIYAVKFWWDRIYKGISWANKIIEEAGNPNVKWNAPGDKERIVSEAKFFRAYYHNFATTLYGDVPIADKFYSEPKLDFVRAPEQTVLEFVRDDLKYASENLPETELAIGKLTKWAAFHLLSEVYLHLGDNANAETTALEIINSGYFHLMTARFGVNASVNGDVFSDLFLENNQNRSSSNMESIFVIQQQYGVTGGKSVDPNGGDWSRRVFTGYYQSVKGLLITDSLGGRGVGRIRPLTSWVKSYEANDIRASKYILRKHYYYNDPKNIPAGFVLGAMVPFTTALDSQRNIYPSTRKWDFGAQSRGGDALYLSNDKDRMKFRLAETYLFLAEAQYLQNKGDRAAETLNIIRTRSGASPISAANVNMDFILDERSRELFSEEDRLLTLHRTGMFLKRVRRLNWSVAAQVLDKHALWPIPQSAIDSNIGAKMNQNEGY